MHKLVIFSSVYHITLLLPFVNTYVLFAANLDDFKSIAKKIVPDDLAEQLAHMASQKSMKSHYDDSPIPVVRPEREDDKSETNEYDEVKKTRFSIKNQGVDIDDIVEKVKERLEKDFEKKHSNLQTASSDKDLEQPKPENKRPRHDVYTNKQSKYENRQSQHEDYDTNQPKHDTYQNTQPKNEKYDNKPLNHANFETEQSKNDNYDEKQSKPGKYEASQQNEDYDNQQPRHEEKPNKYIGYINEQPVVEEDQQQKHKGKEIQDPKEFYDNDEEQQTKHGVEEKQQQKYKVDENQQPKQYDEDIDETQIKVQEKKESQIQDQANQQPKQNEQYEFYEDAHLNQEGIQIEQPKHEFYGKEQPNHEAYQNEQPKIKENKPKIPNYDEKADNIKDYNADQDTKTGNNAETFSKVSLTKHDSYEDYVTPKKDEPFESQYDINAKPTLQVKAADRNPQLNDYDETVNIQVTKENFKEAPNEPEDVQGRTENLFYEDVATDHTNRAVKNTMIPTKRYFRFSSPNYYVKLSTHADKYDFNEPLPEKDRQKEDLKHFPNPAAHINGKVALQI